VIGEGRGFRLRVEGEEDLLGRLVGVGLLVQFGFLVAHFLGDDVLCIVRRGLLLGIVTGADALGRGRGDGGGRRGGHGRGRVAGVFGGGTRLGCRGRAGRRLERHPRARRIQRGGGGGGWVAVMLDCVVTQWMGRRE
jgi:hypothetical protein